MSGIAYRLGRVADAMGYRIVRAYRYPESTMNLVAVGFAALRRSIDGPLVLVQVGAYDGKHNDPLVPILSSASDVRAVLVEPQPAASAELATRYRDHPQITVEQAAICPDDGPVRLYIPTGTSKTPKASLDSNHVHKFTGRKGSVSSIEVQGMSFRTLLTRHNLSHVHLLQIDAEGRDFQILSQAFATGLRPQLINLESRHLNREERRDLRMRLREEGYVYVETTLDTFALLKDAVDVALRG